MKKLIPVAIAALMLCVVFAGVDTEDADADVQPYLWVGTTAIYGQDVEQPTWSFKSSTNTLTLNGLVLTGNEYHEYREMYDRPASAAIYYEGDDILYIVIKGNNTIISNSMYGISNDGNGGLNISGNGTLNVSNRDTYDNAIHVLFGGLTVDGGVLNLVNKVNSASAYTKFNDLTINKGILNCSGRIGTDGGNLVINGGCVNILDVEAMHIAIQAYCDIVIDGDPNIMNAVPDYRPDSPDTIKAALPGDVTISYINETTVTFDANGGSCSTASKKTDYIGAIDSLPEATRDGYVFAGWYTEPGGGERITNSTKFFEDTTVYAFWVNTHVITLDAQGGDVDVSFEVTDLEGKLRSIPEATRDGYRFGGWFTEPDGKGDRVTKSTVFFESTTIYAVWVNGHVIRFDAQGGDVDVPFEVTDVEGKLRSIPNTEREGYIFEGWYTEPYGGEKITEDTVFHTDATAYAHWKMDITIGSIVLGATAALALIIVAITVLLVRRK